MLLVVNADRLPNAAGVRFADAYAAMSPASQAKVHSRFPVLFDPDRGPVITSRETTEIEGHRIAFRDGISLDERLDVVAEFRSVLGKIVAEERALFAIRGVAWWAASVATFFGFVWLLAVWPQRWRFHTWHPGKLILVWLVAGAIGVPLALGGWFGSGMAFLIQIDGLTLTTPSLAEFTFRLLLMPVVTLILGMPTIGIFVVTWMWLSAREAS